MKVPGPSRAARTRTWSLLSEVITDLVYPKRCARCGARGEWVCPICLSALVLHAPPWCQRCGIPAAAARCRCAELPAAIRTCRSLGPYDGWLRGAIIAMKYHDEPARSSRLGELLASQFASFVDTGPVCPVPLHPARERQRGFNQSLLVAERVARCLGVPMLPLLQRTRATAQQVGLDAQGRHLNVAGAFTVDPRVWSGPPLPRVVLIDDVMTTGATMAACATALHSAGVGAVDVLTLARDV